MRISPKILLSIAFALAATQAIEEPPWVKVATFCAAPADDGSVLIASNLAPARGTPKPGTDDPSGGGGPFCPYQENTCACGVPQIDFNDPACTPGVDTGLDSCRNGVTSRPAVDASTDERKCDTSSAEFVGHL